LGSFFTCGQATAGGCCSFGGEFVATFVTKEVDGVEYFRSQPSETAASNAKTKVSADLLRKGIGMRIVRPGKLDFKEHVQARRLVGANDSNVREKHKNAKYKHETGGNRGNREML
jgi:hypothetical protein